ncbi:hypothetical protein [Streptomyces sp. TLI_105]|uniref:hypothetical protein n=1 Tax=Streptomyces sp. TLI_105 TaxID=1881019 RepID=UPI0008954518|nr:hypothetical protein [Streptomyces sp. TLI_105]SEB57031.1 hypothetical protein SAMN05428939_0018 [Streptomyces sp. TLI_105]
MLGLHPEDAGVGGADELERRMMGQATLMGEQVLEPEVDFYGLCLQDADLSVVPNPYPAGRVMEGFVHARPGRVDIESAAHTHTAVMTAQVWDAEPPVDDTRVWDEQAETTVRCRTGKLQVGGVTCGPIAREIELGAPGTQWNVRLYGAGRAEVAKAVEEEGIAEGIETYLVQFWPTA